MTIYSALAFVLLAFVRIGWTSIEVDTPGSPEADEFLHYFKATRLDGHFGLRTSTSTRVSVVSFDYYENSHSINVFSHSGIRHFDIRHNSHSQVVYFSCEMVMIICCV